MSRIKRRHFLQLAGSTLATLGWSQNNLLNASNNYGKVLAQNNSRKLALLIGINEYDRDANGWIPLKGCTTDIQLQRELLVNCFGFKTQDIKILRDRDATRQNILMLFEEHLIRQAKPGDVVVFHYSGHGSRVRDIDSEDGVDGTIVPIDSPYPSNQEDKVKDITGGTIFLLTSALNTDNVTVVLDCCYSGGTTRGNLRIRSRSSNSRLQVIATEKEYQQRWLSRLNLSRAEFIKRRGQGIAKGVAITSAKKNQLAADVSFDGFAAGAFTYAMTQYLWQHRSNPLLDPTIAYTSNAITTISPSSLQQPLLEIAPNQNNGEPVYFLNKQIPPAEAVITSVNNNSVKFWLGGVEAKSIHAFNRGATFSVIDSQQNSIAKIQLNSREGLIGYGKLASNPQQNISNGNLLQEEIRSIPANLKLKIGIDVPDNTQWQEIKQAFAQFKQIEILPLQQGEIDYIFGRFGSQTSSMQISPTPPLQSLGLFYPDYSIVRGSFHAKNETISSAVERLQNKLQSLLAIKLIRLTLNPHASRLKVSATLSNPNTPQRLLVESVTDRNNFNYTPQYRSANSSGIEPIPLGTSLQLAITNHEERPVYLNILAIDSEGEIIIIFPNNWTNLAQQILVPANKTLQIPDSHTSGFELRTAQPLGMTEVLIVCSTNPLKRSLVKLEQLARSEGVSRGAMVLSQPWEVIEDLLTDFDVQTRNSVITPEKKSNHLIDTTQLAILSIPFEVIL